MVLSPGMYGEVDPEIAETALLGALEVGCSFIDTSDGYDAGENETLIGSFASGRRGRYSSSASSARRICSRLSK